MQFIINMLHFLYLASLYPRLSEYEVLKALQHWLCRCFQKFSAVKHDRVKIGGKNQAGHQTELPYAKSAYPSLWLPREVKESTFMKELFRLRWKCAVGNNLCLSVGNNLPA